MLDMIDCETCNREFVNWHAVSQHMNALGHWGCTTCDAAFQTEDDAEEHMQTAHRAPQFDCEACNDTFDTLRGAKQHMYAKNHWQEHWCNSCEKGFESENHLRTHLHSNKHRDSSINCPFCKRAFTTATGVAHHLETGSCPNARSANHSTILTEIRRRDPHHKITKRLLTYPSSTSTKITATEATYNHHRNCYECYLCHKGFGSLQGLNNHVNSAAHREKVYHCPKNACGREFAGLAGLFNHLESETCGAVRFDTVQRNVGDFLCGRKLIRFA